MLEFPEGTKWSLRDALKDVVDSHPVSTLQKVDHYIDLDSVSPWGFPRRELHFLIVPPGKSSLRMELILVPTPP